VGALVLARGGPFPSLFPGTQERARRGGTVNVAGAVGFGVAARCALASRASRAASARDRRERLEAGLVARGARVVGVAAERAPGTTLVVFPGVRGDALVGGLDAHGISVSAGAACASGSAQPSAALVAVGDPEPHGALRVSHGHASTVADIDALFAALDVVLPGLRSEASWLDWLDG
jgi:cysteine desulfurase